MLNPQSPTPLYHQLAEVLSGQIRSGTFPPGSRIPSEHQLAEEFALGRPTVRQAIELLVRRGMLAKRRGSGTFVCEPQREVALFSLDGTGAAFRDKGLDLETLLIDPARLISVDDQQGNPFDDDQAYFLSRLARVEGAPVLLEEIFLHAALFAGIDRINLQGASLSAIAEERFHLRPIGGRQSFRIEYPDSRLAQLLEVESKVPILRVDRFLDFPLADNGFFSRIYCRTDRFVFSQNMGGFNNE